MSGPQSAGEWAEFYSRKRDREQARAAAQQAKAPKPRKDAHQPHWMAMGPLPHGGTFHPNLPPDDQMRLLDAHAHHQRHAEAEVRRRHEERIAEHARQNAPHPLAHGPLAQIPVPQPPEPQRRRVR